MIGADEEKYRLYANFKQRVLLKAQKELDKKTRRLDAFATNKKGK